MSCEFQLTPGRGTTGTLDIRNLGDRERITEDFDRVCKEPQPIPCYYDTALTVIYSEMMEFLSPVKVRLSGIEMRIIDLEELLRSADVPEVLEIKDCVLRFDGTVDMNWAKLDNIAFSLWTNARHVSFVDIKATLYQYNSWTHLFSSLSASSVLESFRFERVENVFFDWDGDRNLDDSTRLPEIIQQVGIQQALLYMEKCYRHLQSTCEYAPVSDDEGEADDEGEE